MLTNALASQGHTTDGANSNARGVSMPVSLFSHVRQSGRRLTISKHDYDAQLRRIRARDKRNILKQIAGAKAQLARIDALANAAQALL